MGCGTKALKVSAIVFNVLIATCGILILVGTILATKEGDINKSTAISTYVIAAIAIILAILGILAAIRESVNLAVFVTFIFLALAITHIVLICIQRSNRDPHEGLNLVNKAWGNNTHMDAIQTKYECCGKASVQDYINLHHNVPASCYASKDQSKTDTLYMAGCSLKVQEFYEQNERNVLIGSWVLIAFELIGFFLHLYLFINFRNKQRRLQF